jgi:GINS complex subunit 4
LNEKVLQLQQLLQ